MSSTYTDLGIELIATGAADGTWGTKTNTNLEIINQIQGYVNKSIAGGTQMTMSLGDESAFTDHTVEVTGQALTMSQGDETVTADANVTPTGISLTSSIGSVEQNTIYSVTGISMTMSLGEETPTADANVTLTGIQLQSNTGSPNITSWEEIDPGVSNVWTEVDLAA